MCLTVPGRLRRVSLVLVVAAVAAAGAVFAVRALLPGRTPVVPTCTVGTGPDRLLLSPDQAADAATIAVVGQRLGLRVRAVTVALATALQESKLHNYPFGDRDSLGLFQQRPSQGWGRPDQLLTPSYAATAFFQHLRRVPSWQRLQVASAAQAVQHSADGSAYAQWEESARVLARILTGRVARGMTCRFDHAAAVEPARLRALATRELGPDALTRTDGSAPVDWSVAGWLVAHSYAYGVTEVSVRGQRWTASTGEWRPDRAVAGPPRYVLGPRTG